MNNVARRLNSPPTDRVQNALQGHGFARQDSLFARKGGAMQGDLFTGVCLFAPKGVL